MKFRFTTIIPLLLLVAGCCTPWHGPAVITTPVGQLLCAKHRVALITCDGYRIHTEPKMFVDPTEQAIRAGECYPNAIPWFESRSGPGDPCKLTYCPLCEKAAERIRH